MVMSSGACGDETCSALLQLAVRCGISMAGGWEVRLAAVNKIVSKIRVSTSI